MKVKAYIGKNRHMRLFGCDYNGKTEHLLVMVDCPSPSSLHRLKEKFGDFKGVDQWELDPACKNELIEQAKARINLDTKMEIIHKFMYKGVQFRLTIEDQINYKADYDLPDFVTYPKNIDGTEFDKSEFESFYIASVFHRQKIIESGRKKKAELASKTVEDLYEIIKG